MKKLLIVISLILTKQFLFGQSKVEEFYGTVNQIETAFASSSDTSKYYKSLKILIKNNGELYANLKHRTATLKEVFSYGDIELSQTLITNRLSYDITHLSYVKNKRYIQDKQLNVIYSYPSILKRNERFYKKKRSLSVYENFDFYKAIAANNYYWPDQLGRSIATSDIIKKDSLLFAPIIIHTDSLNLFNLYYNIEENGFPITSEVANFDYFFLLWHTFARPCDYSFVMPNNQGWFEYLDSTLLDALKKGNFRNSEYAFFIDKGMTYSQCPQEGQKYGTLYRSQKLTFPLISVENVDLYRAEIFLPPLWVDAALKGFKLPMGYIRKE